MVTETNKSTYDRVKEVVVRELSIPESKVTESATFDGDLQVDSLGMVRVLAAIEDEFDMDISDDDAESIKSVGDMVYYVVRHLEEKGA